MFKSEKKLKIYKDIILITNSIMNFILIDGSYFIYHRYYSLKTWWKNARRETESTTPCENPRFIEKFRTTCKSKIEDLVKLYSKDSKPIIMIGKDCYSKSIWRREIFPEYKFGRKKDEDGVGQSFKLTYKDNVFQMSGADCILYDDELEADDCIAITTQHIIKNYPHAEVYIITSDMDYLQLVEDRVHIYNLKGDKLTDSKNSFNDPKKDLFCKIVAGDKSDNIASVFPRCGVKTAEKYYHDMKSFQEKLESHEQYKTMYHRNKTLVDFDNIPEHLRRRFEQNCLQIK